MSAFFRYSVTKDVNGAVQMRVLLLQQSTGISLVPHFWEQLDLTKGLFIFNFFDALSTGGSSSSGFRGSKDRLGDRDVTCTWTTLVYIRL